MKKLIIKIGNEKHELPYNGEVFSFEVEEKYVPKDGDKVWFYSLLCEVVSYIFDKDNTMLQLLAERGLIFPTEAECQKFADHCLKYFDKKSL